MKKIIFLCLLWSVSWAEAQSDTAQLARAGGVSVVEAVRAEGLAGAVRLSGECSGLLRIGERSADYCLGVETASMQLLKRGVSSAADPVARAWFSAEEMTQRVLSYCYTYMELRGDMACFMRVAAAKEATGQTVAVYAAQAAFRRESAKAETLRQP